MFEYNVILITFDVSALPVQPVNSYPLLGVAVIDITVPSFKVPPGVDTTPPAPAFMVAVNCLTIISSSAEDEQDVKIKAIIEINILNFKFICFKFNYFF